MKVYTCRNHNGYWPVPTASVVVAPNEVIARILLDAELMARGLKTSVDYSYTLVELDTGKLKATILQDGDY